MKSWKRLGGLSMALVAAAWSISAAAGGRRAMTGEGLNPEVMGLAAGNTAFALNLYARLRQQEGNLFLSPYSISSALAMTWGGARGTTEEEMAAVLHFTLGQERLHPAFADLQAQLKAIQEQGEVELNVASALWGDKQYRFLDTYLRLAEKDYGAPLTPVDFRHAAEAARRTINAWVEERTKERIKDLIPPGILDSMTRLVLTNAIYFKGQWAERFEEKRTREEPFLLAPGRSVPVKLMQRRGDYGYYEDEKLQALELPYRGGDLSMVVLLPRRVDGLAELEGALAPAALDSWTSGLRQREVDIWLPRFTMTAQFSLSDTLQAMGMRAAFGEGADFSGIDGTRMLYISAVLHKAFVEVNEEGTEAAAATAVVMKLSAAMPSAVPEFRADHPFLFLIRDSRTGSLLFLGRVVNPAG